MCAVIFKRIRLLQFACESVEPQRQYLNLIGPSNGTWVQGLHVKEGEWVKGRQYITVTEDEKSF